MPFDLGPLHLKFLTEGKLLDEKHAEWHINKQSWGELRIWKG